MCVGGHQLPTFDAESKNPNSLYSVCVCVCVWGGGGSGPTFDAESKSAKNLNSLYSGEGGEYGLGPMFDADSKSDIKKPTFPIAGEGDGVQDQLLMLSPNLLKTYIPYTVGSGANWDQVQICENRNSLYGGEGDGPVPTFKAESKSAKNPNSLYSGGLLYHF